MKYSLHPEALRELRDASCFYFEQSGSPLAQALIAEVERLASLICPHPGIGSPYRHNTRRLVMRRFPYAVVYVPTDDEVRIVAIAHHSRRPGYWQGRE